jgi:DNA-directed RNA polymerase subunit beta'
MEKTLGHLLLEDAIPSEYRPSGPYTKGALFKQMLRLAKDNPELYAKTIVRVKNIGDEVATMEGISVGLDDIAPIYAQRDAVVRPALAQMQKAKTREQRQEIVSRTQSKLLDYAKNHPGTMGDMARSGGRGNMVQLMKAVGSPVAANDEKDRVQPWLITKSYSEGLKPSEWWAANREARMAAVKSTLEVSEPGDLSKIIVNNTNDQVITRPDCGTHNGIRLNVRSNELLDRYTPAPENKRITKKVLDDLRGGKTEFVTVRSPMTCEAHPGVCQLCMGHTVTGSLNKIGDNVGVRAAHSLGEPLTQLALNAKHGVRTAGGTAGVSGLEGFRALIETPASFKNKATLAPVDGMVIQIEKAPQGGHYVTVRDKEHRVHVAPGLAVTVKKGDSLHAGDVLSEGTPRPDEVVKYKGLGAGREYLVDQLDGVYRGAGVDVDRRHLEILAKSALNHMHVDRVDPNDHGIVRGDVIDYNRFKKLVGDSIKEVSLDNAIGKPLARSVQEHLPGTLVTPGLASDLKKRGIQKVTISTLNASVSPIMAPATRAPLLNPDWLVRMGHRQLKQSLLEGAHMGHISNISGTSPVPALIFNPDFGNGPDGAY